MPQHVVAKAESNPLSPREREQRFADQARKLRRRLPSLGALRAFEAAARHGSISRAADELCVTHAAISRHVARLEGFLNAKLFERRNQLIVLTKRGAAYASELQRIFDDLHEVTRTHFEQVADGSALRIGVQSTFALRLLIPRLARFKEQFPDISLEVESSHKAIDPRVSDVDVAIWLGDGRWPDLHCVQLFEEELVPVGSPSLLAQHAIDSVEDLRHFLLLHVEARMDDWQRWLAAMGARSIDASSGLRLESSALAYEGAVNALGLAMAQTMLVREDIAQHRLKPVFDRPIKTGRSYYAVHLPSNPHGAAIEKFTRWLSADALDGAVAAPRRRTRSAVGR